jgi:hypothetical protein
MKLARLYLTAPIPGISSTEPQSTYFDVSEGYFIDVDPQSHLITILKGGSGWVVPLSKLAWGIPLQGELSHLEDREGWGLPPEDPVTIPATPGEIQLPSPEVSARRPCGCLAHGRHRNTCPERSP